MEQRFETTRGRSNGFFIGAICALVIAAFAFCAALFVPQHNAYAVTDGWEQWGTCEWQIDDEGTLTIRPVDDGETGVLGSLDENPIVPWEVRSYKIKTVNIPKQISAEGTLESLFANCQVLTSINNLGNLDTSQVTSMAGMFANCSSLKSIDLSELDTSNVTSMASIFGGCFELESANLSYLDAQKVTSMASMFEACSALTTVNFEGIKTEALTSMASMFTSCASLESVELGYLDTSNVTSFWNMFAGCSSLASIDIASLDTRKAENMGSMFRGCSSLSSIAVSDVFISESCETVAQIFEGCTSLVNIPDNFSFGPNADSLNKNWAFYNSGSNSLDTYYKGTDQTVINYDWAGDNRNLIQVTATPGWNQFGTCEWQIDGEGTLTIRPLGNADGGEIEDMDDLGGVVPWDTQTYKIKKVSIPKPINAYGSVQSLFANCSQLIEVDGLSNLDTSNVTNMAGMFSGCSSLKSIDLSGLNTSNVFNMGSMFGGCFELESVSLSGLDTSKVTNMSHMFEACSSLKTVDFTGIDTSSVTSMASMFTSCASLESIDVSEFDTSRVEIMRYMFSACFSLTSLDVSGFDTSSATDMSGMFRGCTKLSSITLPDDFIGENCTNINSLFAACDSLTTIPENFSFGSNVDHLNMIWAFLYDSPESGEEPLATYYTGSDPYVLVYNWAADNRKLITPATDISGTVAVSGNPCAGVALKAVVSLDDSCANAQLLYQWFDVTDNSSVTEATDSAEFVIPEGSEDKSFYCVVTDGSGTYGSSLKSNAIAASHTFGKWVITTEPTCVDEGEETRTCEKCGATETRTIPAKGHSPIDAWSSDESGHWHACANCDEHLDAAEHNFGEWVEKDAVTCTEGGTEARTCATCGYEETRETDPAGHSFGEWSVTTPATCTAEGVESRTCKKCGETETRAIDATGHSFGEWVTTTEPTCTEEGEETRTCEKCDATETRPVDAKGHTAGEAWESDATDHWHICTECGTELDSEAHKFGEWTTTVEPAEDIAGERERTCEVCNYVETAEIPATGHTADETWHSDESSHWHVCTGCGEEIEKSAHEYGEWTTTLEPTCTEEGTKTRACTVCGYEQTETIPSSGHSFGEWKVTTEPTCVDEGEETRTCANCDATETRPVAATGQHVYADWTSDENGHRHVCETCGLVTDDAAHEFSEWSVTTAATCTEDGVEARTCTVCGYEETRPVAAPGHEPATEWSSDASEHWHACANCDEHLDAAAHDFGEWTVTKEATCTEDGSQTRACATCGYEETAVIPAAGHSFGDWEIISDATETQDGSTKHVCKVCGFEETVAIPATGSQQGGQDNDQQGGQTDNAQGGSSNASGDSANGSNALAQTGDATPVVPIALGTLATLAVAGIAMRKLRA